jgi:hypothetical protein
VETTKTVKVKSWGEGQGDFVEINEIDFDKSKHELYDESTEKKAAEGNAALTKAQIIEKLTALNVEHDASAKKDELLAKLDEAEKKAAE